MKCTHAHPARRGIANGIGLVAALIALTLSAGIARADTRAAIIARQQAEKTKRLQRYIPSRGETILTRVRNYFSQPRGFYPMIGTVYSGGGLALGVGYHGYYGDDTSFDLKALYSIRSYKKVEVSTTSQGLSKNRLSLHAIAGWLDATAIPFHGIGNNSPQAGRTNFRLTSLSGGAGAQLKPIFPFVFSGDVTYEGYDTKKGLGTRPSIETQWDPTEVPGLGADPVFIHSRASGSIDWRPASGFARRGGLYEVDYHIYRDRDDVYSFERLDGDIVQHIPLFREKYVISLHGRLETMPSDDPAPYFLLPSLGGSSSLRGYPSWRFRDRHSMLMQAELRWAPNRYGMDMALFYDTGKVAARRSDLDFNDLKDDFGIGARFHSTTATFLRLEVAHSNEGTGVVFAGSAAF